MLNLFETETTAEADSVTMTIRVNGDALKELGLAPAEPEREMTLLVARNVHHRDMLRRQLRGLDHVIVAAPGDGLMGYRFELIVISDSTIREMHLQGHQREIEAFNDWLDHQVKIKLTREGKMVAL